jgi:HAD superfamily hydrolase (TIGR01509 family)
MRKPNPAIYRHALELLGGVAPERSVFLDDFAPNVAAARALGCHGIVVEHPDQAIDELGAIIDAQR